MVKLYRKVGTNIYREFIHVLLVYEDFVHYLERGKHTKNVKTCMSEMSEFNNVGELTEMCKKHSTMHSF